MMSLLFNTLSSFVIAILPRSERLLISRLQSLSSLILKPKEMKSYTASTFSPFICHEVIGPDAMILVFWMLSFKPAFSLLSFVFIKSLFSSSSFHIIKVVSSIYLWLLIFLPAILIPAYASSGRHFAWCTLHIRKLNKQGDNIQPWCTPFPIWNLSVVPCLSLTVVFWPAYRFSGGR